MARRPVSRRLEMGIAEAAIATAREKYALPWLGEIGDQGFAVLVVDMGPGWHFEDGIRAIGAMAVLAHARAAVLCGEVLLVAIIDQRIEAFDRDRDDVTAFAAVAAIGPTIFDEFLAPERHATVAAVAGANIDLGFVQELRADLVTGRRRPDNRYPPCWPTSSLIYSKGKFLRAAHGLAAREGPGVWRVLNFAARSAVWRTTPDPPLVGLPVLLAFAVLLALLRIALQLLVAGSWHSFNPYGLNAVVSWIAVELAVAALFVPPAGRATALSAMFIFSMAGALAGTAIRLCLPFITPGLVKSAIWTSSIPVT